MAAPTPTSAHSAPPSTSPAPASAGAQYPAPSPIALEGIVPGMFPPPPAYPTFVHNGVSYVYIPVPVAFLPAQTHVTSRKRKRPAVPPPCTLCRLSRTPCVAARPGEACARCIRKQVECFDDGETTDTARIRHPPEDDGPEDVDSEPERDPNQPPLWQLPANGYPPSYPPPPPSYPPTTTSTPIKRERATKACAECHARKRKCTGIGGPNCGSTGPRPTPANGAPSGSGARPSPRKSTPGGASGHTRVREPCADCRGRKRRCIHHSDPGSSRDDGANGTDVDAQGDESMRTDHEGDSLQPPSAGRTSHRVSHPRSRSPRRGSHSPPPGGRWQPHPPNSYYAQPPPPFGYQHAEHRLPYPHPGQGQFLHPPHPHDGPYAHPPPPPPHPHGLHPHPHPHARLPPAPDMRHPVITGTGCKDCHARGVTCTCPDTRAADSGSNAGSSSSAHTAAPSGPVPPAKGATPAPPAAPAPPAGRKGRACLACRKLKMRCVAPSNANGENTNGNNNPDGPDERCQRCERAGLECIYVDRKRRGPGTVFGAPGDGTTTFEGYAQQATPNNGGANGTPVAAAEGNGTGTPSRPPAKKLKRETSPGAGGQPARSSPYPPGAPVPGVVGERRRVSGDDALMQLVSGDDARMQRVMGEDAARALEETFADDDEEGAGGR